MTIAPNFALDSWNFRSHGQWGQSLVKMFQLNVRRPVSGIGVGVAVLLCFASPVAGQTGSANAPVGNSGGAAGQNPSVAAPAAASASALAPAPVAPACVDTCATASNGLCEDGSVTGLAASCATGTDCADCRVTGACSNSCSSAFDGECDDGGPGALFDICVRGTDCADCGSRLPLGCTNTCSTAYDGECDDGGAGATYEFCEFGSDCADCGPRETPAIADGSGEGSGAAQAN